MGKKGFRGTVGKRKCRLFAVALSFALLAGQFDLSACAEELTISSSDVKAAGSGTDEGATEEGGGSDDDKPEENGGAGDDDVPEEGGGTEDDNVPDEDEDAGDSSVPGESEGGSEDGSAAEDTEEVRVSVSDNTLDIVTTELSVPAEPATTAAGEMDSFSVDALKYTVIDEDKHYVEVSVANSGITSRLEIPGTVSDGNGQNYTVTKIADVFF